MSNIVLGVQAATNSVALLAADADEGWVFGLDAQFLVDVLIMACAMLVLFGLLSYLLFEPARNLMEKRQQMIDADINNAKSENEKAQSLRADYEAKLLNADKEAEAILDESRKKAIIRENQIIEEAKMEAARIIQYANKEAELEKSKVRDEVKQEMIAVATAMAGKFVATSIDDKKQATLIDETLREMGDSTWQN